MLSKKNVFNPAWLALSSSRTADVFPEPEAPITKYVVCIPEEFLQQNCGPTIPMG
jgi:hypothetical protein